MTTRRKALTIPESTEVVLDVPGLEPGTIIQVKGERGLRFKVKQVIAGPNPGQPIVECWEMEGQKTNRYRAFHVHRVKLPRRRRK